MNIQKIRGLIVSVIALCSLHACVDVDKTLGLDYVSDDQWLQVDFYEFTIPVFTAAIDSICTSNLSAGSVGYMINDPFGLFYTGSVFRIIPASVYYSGSYTYQDGAVIDSTILYIPISHKMETGNYNTPQTFYLHQLNRDLESNTHTYYYNNSLKPTDYDPIAVADPLPYNGEDTLKFRLTPAFAQALLSATAEEMSNDTLFLERYKGLYLTVDTTDQGQQGGRIAYFNHSDVWMTSYYTYNLEGTDTTGYCLYYINTDYANFNVLKHSSKHLVNDQPAPNDYAYIEGLAGVKPYIDFNSIKDTIQHLLNSLGSNVSKLVINRLEIKIDADYPTYSMDTYPAMTTLAYKDTSAYRFNFLTDTYLGYFGGTLNRSLQQYSYNPTYFTQGLFTPHSYDNFDVSETPLYIYPCYSYYDSYYGTTYKGLERTEYSFGVLKGPVKVKLSYTLLK